MKKKISDKKKKYAFLTAVIMLSIFTWLFLLQASGMTDTIPDNMSETISLPAPLKDSNTSIEEALIKRRSVRNYKDSALKLAEISQLLWAAQGTSSPEGLRTAPSAGALYPLEVYIAAGNVDGLPGGVYRYKPHNHELAMIVRGDRRNELCKAALGQPSVRNAAAVIVFSAFYDRTTQKYRDRGIQYVHIETGHAAQNVFLQAVPLALGTVVIGAFHDDEVRKVLKMSDMEQPLYIMPVGRTESEVIQ